MGHDSFIHGTWLIHTCWHSITHDAGNPTLYTFIFVYGTWLIHLCAQSITQDAGNSTVNLFIFIYEAYLIHMWKGTRLYGGHDLFIRVHFPAQDASIFFFNAFMFIHGSDTWLIYICGKTYSHLGHDPFLFGYVPAHSVTAILLFIHSFLYMGPDSFIHEAFLIHVCAHISAGNADNSTIHSPIFIYGTHDWLISGTWLFGMCAYSTTHNAGNSIVHAFIFVYGTWLIHTWDMTHSHVCIYKRGKCR